MIRRHKTTIFTDAKESTTVYELKRIVEGILKRAPEEQRLYKVYRVHTPCGGQLQSGGVRYGQANESFVLFVYIKRFVM